MGIFFILVGPVGYTFSSAVTEPHTLTPVTTSIGFAEKVADSGNGSATTLFYYTFGLYSSNATFAFSMQPPVNDYYAGNQAHFIIDIMKTHQNIPWHIGNVQLNVKNVNISITINNTSYGYAGLNGPSGFPMGMYYGNTNKSVVVIGTEYNTNRSIEINNYGLTNDSVQNVLYARSCNITYSIELQPLLEIGPYYSEGKTIWISHSFLYPFNQSTGP